MEPGDEASKKAVTMETGTIGRISSVGVKACSLLLIRANEEKNYFPCWGEDKMGLRLAPCCNEHM